MDAKLTLRGSPSAARAPTGGRTWLEMVLLLGLPMKAATLSEQLGLPMEARGIAISKPVKTSAPEEEPLPEVTPAVLELLMVKAARMPSPPPPKMGAPPSESGRWLPRLVSVPPAEEVSVT